MELRVSKNYVRMNVKSLFLVFCFLCMCTCMDAQKASDSEWNDLIWAIAQHESKQNPHARNGQYLGILQISPVLVSECNKIVGYRKFSNADRANREKSIEMFNTIQGRYNPQRDMNLAVRLTQEIGPEKVVYRLIHGAGHNQAHFTTPENYDEMEAFLRKFLRCEA